VVVRALVRLFALAVLLALGWLALTTFATGSAVASWAPCPRNWAYLDAWLPRASPLEFATFRFDEGEGKVCYGSPALRGRTMLGGAAVPYGRLWRTGANEPTTLHLSVDVELGGIHLEPGSYSIYTIPRAERWTVILNRATRQWGIESEYTRDVERHEVGRFDVPVERLSAPVERFQIRAHPLGGDDWRLDLEWQTSRVRIPLTRPDPEIELEMDDELDELTGSDDL